MYWCSGSAMNSPLPPLNCQIEGTRCPGGRHEPGGRGGDRFRAPCHFVEGSAGGGDAAAGAFSGCWRGCRSYDAGAGAGAHRFLGRSAKRCAPAPAPASSGSATPPAARLQRPRQRQQRHRHLRSLPQKDMVREIDRLPRPPGSCRPPGHTSPRSGRPIARTAAAPYPDRRHLPPHPDRLTTARTSTAAPHAGPNNVTPRAGKPAPRAQILLPCPPCPYPLIPHP